MNYYRIVYYTDGVEYDTREIIVDEPMFRRVQKAIGDGVSLLMVGDAAFKQSAIKEMGLASDIVEGYKAMGFTPKQMGVKELKQLPGKEGEEKNIEQDGAWKKLM